MGQRSKAPGKVYTRPRRKSVRPKRRSASKAVRPQLAGAVVPDTDAARLRRELDEALAQQTATSKVLEVISSSAFDLQAVFDAVVESSARLCAAERAFFFRLDGELLRTTATYNVSTEVNEWFERNPIRVDGKSITGRSALKRRTINVTDVLADPDYKYPAKAIETYRSFLAVPVLKGIDLLGVISLYHPEVKPFTDRQVAVVETFAHQAAIAIENARLFEAEQQRSRELTESLEQQTATAKVLQVISRSTFNLPTVLSTLVESAARLCLADQAALFLRDGDVYRMATTYGSPSETTKHLADRPLQVDRTSMTGRVALAGKAVHVHDVLADPEYRAIDYQQAFGYRTNLGVPLLRDGATIGVFALVRTEVNPFTDKQIELVTTFADQAVIAIENARLFTELQELLEQQTATSEILGSISGSLTDPRPVFDAIVSCLLRLFGARFATVQLLRDGTVEMPAADGQAAIDKIMAHYPRPLDDATVGGQAMLSNQVVQYAPVIGNPIVPPAAQQIARDYQYDSIIACADDPAGQGRRCHRLREPRAESLRREGGRAHQILRRPGGHRHRERTATHRVAGAH